MTQPFIASPPSDQNATTYRQFVELQRYIEDLEQRIAPLYGGGAVDPLVLTDTYQTLTLQPYARGIPSEEAVYFMILRLNATGSTANAFIQLRLTSGGDVVEGAEVDIGNNELEIATIAATLPIGATGFFLEARGEACEVVSGAFDMHRVGSGP